jgi:hypothetical protein
MLAFNTPRRPRPAALLFLAILLTLSLACGRSAPQEWRFPSPDGRLALAVSVNQSQAPPPPTCACTSKSVRPKPRVLYCEQTSASSRLTWSVEWEDNMRLQLDSSDVGTLCWEDVGSGWGRCAP